MEQRDEAQASSAREGQRDSSAPKANNRTRRARHYRNRRGASDPKDLIPSDLSLIKWTDEDGDELFKRRTLSLTLGQVRSVCGQLGYLPLNIVSVGAKNMKPGMQEAPLVAILYPLAMNKLARQGRSHLIKKQDADDKGKSEWDPFPTTCWLTCPLLHAQICKREDAGWIQKLEERLKSSDDHVKSMEGAHKAYQRFRWDLLGASDRNLVERMGWSNMLKRDVGIAGIRVFNSVKCLHCHYAHFLARPQDNNIIGKWVDELLEEDGFNGGAELANVKQGRGGTGSPSRVHDTAAAYRRETHDEDAEDEEDAGTDHDTAKGYETGDDANDDDTAEGEKQEQASELDEAEAGRENYVDFASLSEDYSDGVSFVSSKDTPTVASSASPYSRYGGSSSVSGSIREEAGGSVMGKATYDAEAPPSEIGTDLGTEVVEQAHNENPYGFHWASMLSPTKSAKQRTRVPGESPPASHEKQCSVSDCICT